jgi:salicylate hydroxylase
MARPVGIVGGGIGGLAAALSLYRAGCDVQVYEQARTLGEIADALAAYEGSHSQVREILGAVDETFVWALFDRPPLERWSIGRVTLLGDARHAMLPFMAQGAAQAIEDGAALTACLRMAGPGDAAGALQRYEELRLPRTARIQEMSTGNKERFHLPDGSDQERRDARMASGSTDWSIQAIAWIYGHDAGLLESGDSVRAAP